MTVNLSALGGAGQQFFDNNGNVLTGGKLWSYQAGTTTPQTTYTSVSGATAHTNPIILDSAGRVATGEIWLTAGSNYKFVLMTSANVTLATWDNITGINGTGIATNAEFVAYDPPFANAVATNVEVKLAQTVSVKDFGAVGNGIANDTSAFEDAIAVGKPVYVPAGTYLVNFVNVPSNTFLYGDGEYTTIKPLTSGIRCAIGADSGGSSIYVENITIRDIKFLGDVASVGFNEQCHLTSFNGVKNLLIENCHFVGFRGDGIYFGSGNTSGQERHNVNVTVRSCFFDGINKDNRNGISVIDGDGVLIDGNYFTRTTRSNMPGAVDIEPNANTYHVVKDIKVVNNKFYDIGGNVGVISVFMPGVAYTTAPNGFLIQGNYIQDCTASGVYFAYNLTGGVTESTPNFALKIANNSIAGSDRPFNIGNAKDALVIGNSFLGSTRDALISNNTGNEDVLDCIVTDNLFYACGSTGGNGLTIYTCSRVTVDGNTFKDCGTGAPGASNAINFGSSGTSSFVSLTNNIIVSPSGTTLVAVATQGTHVTTASSNTYLNNTTGSLSVVFAAENNDFAETTYTPIVTGSTSAGTGTYTIQYGRWRRVGKIVFFRVQLDVAAGHTGTGMIQVGLPTGVAAASGNAQTTVALVASGVATTGGHIGLINPALVVSGNGAVRCYYTATGTLAQMVIPAGAFTVNVSGFYQAS